MKYLLALAALSLGCPAAQADWTFTVGGVAVVANLPYADMKDDGKLLGAPVLMADSEGLFFDSGMLGMHLWSREGERTAVSLDTFVTAGDGYERSDSPRLQGMQRRGAHTDIGLHLDVMSVAGQSSVSVQRDVSGRSDGWLASVSHALPIPAGPVIIAPMLRLDYFSAHHATYYYGVRRAEVRPDRAAYRAHAGLHYTAGYMLIWPLSDAWAVMHGIEYTWLDDAIRSSPLVERDHLVGGVVGLTYSF